MGQTHIHYCLDEWQHGGMANHQGWTPFVKAASDGKERVVDVLLQGGERPDIEMAFALAMADVNGHTKVSEMLRQARVTANKGRTLPRFAAEPGDQDTVTHLVARNL